ncbi:hypothetical protein [Blastococcus sp. URHD0036]|jgi:hypothetical protein|uniref:hypothetical protein n=1 Tax=Blastococcus sp. URHD0036 TaxID=1380356 RepID=UPI0012DCE4C1|nr:hypothetical protein [Blastococcus sp. URHD0036]
MTQSPDLDPSTHQPLHDVTEADDEVEVATAHRLDAIGGDVEAVDPVHHGGAVAGGL